MPTRKPTALIERHETAAEIANREGKDAAVRPERRITTNPPVALKGHPQAKVIWRRMMRIYGQLEAEIVTRLDLDLLLDYCILSEQVMELDRMRRAAYEIWSRMNEAWEELSSEISIKEKMDEAVKVNMAMADCVKLDGRVDRKRALLFQLRQSLYLTPRARAGSIPSQKKLEEQIDPVAQMLDNVKVYVNTDKSGGQHA
jgi:hypothetical protein